MSRTSVLLFPADVPSARLDGPHYAEVTARRGGTVQVTILPRSDDVCYRVGDVFKHGQITAYNNTVYVVTTEGETHEVPFSAPIEIAPAVAVLLWNAVLLEDIVSMTDLEAAHALILDRLLGQNGQRATKSIPRLLAGISTRQSMPRPSAMVPWVWGHELLVSVVDVLNFAFYVDGGRPIPANVRVGATFLDGPATRPAQGSRRPRSGRQVSVAPNDDGPTPPATTLRELQRRTRRTTSTAAIRTGTPTVVDAPSSGEEESSNEGAAATRFSDLLDALSSDHPAPKRRRTVRTEQAPPTPVGHVSTTQGDSRAEPAAADPMQAILHALAPYPSVLAAYAQQLQRLSPPATSPSQVTGMSPPSLSQAVGISASPSDLIPLNEPSDRRQQNFRPSRAQQEVHDAILAPAYIGKDGDVYMDHVRTSAATKFLAHPAIASRLFDIEFSACDLSILHFPRFDLNSQLDRSKAKAVNMRNFSSKVALPELPDKPVFSDLTEALSVLYTFAKEFFNEETRGVFAAAKDFGEQLEDFAPWSSSEVHILAFWFSNIIGAYRLAVIEDMRSGSSTSHSVRFRFTMQDPELAGLLFKASRARANQTSGTNGPLPTRDSTRALHKGGNDDAARQGAKRRDRKVPQEISAQVPKKDGRQLCLRYASVQGCSSKSKDRCLQSFLAHFEPAELPEAVAAYIRDAYGGVRTFAKQE